MNINKAIEHFKFKFTNVWKPTQKDVEAFNSILDFKDIQESRNLNENESLAKLWIFTMIRLNTIRGYDGKECIKQIDDILKIDLYEWVKELQSNYFLSKFNNIIKDYPDYAKAIQDYNITKIDAEGKKIMSENKDRIMEALKHEPKEEIYIKFIESQIARIINTFEK